MSRTTETNTLDRRRHQRRHHRGPNTNSANQFPPVHTVIPPQPGIDREKLGEKDGGKREEVGSDAVTPGIVRASSPNFSS